MVLRASLIFALGLLLSADVLSTTSSSNHTGAVLSRHKRYLTFPEGSTYSFAFCMEVKTISEDYDLYTEGVAVAANYDLPTKPELLFTVKPRPPVPVLQRRHRRDLYGNLENILNLAGVDGRSCVLLALCEASQKLPPGVGMLEEIVRIFLQIFSSIHSEFTKHITLRLCRNINYSLLKKNNKNVDTSLVCFMSATRNAFMQQNLNFRRLLHIKRYASSDANNNSDIVCYSELGKLRKNGNVVIVDVRNRDETWRTGTIPGSVCVPLKELESALQMSAEQFEKTYCKRKPSPKENLLFMCRKGERSYKAFKLAKSMGYKNSKSFQGGFMGWFNQERIKLEKRNNKDSHKK